MSDPRDPITFNHRTDDGHLACPLCGSEFTHVDRVALTTGMGQRATLEAIRPADRTHGISVFHGEIGWTHAEGFEVDEDLDQMVGDRHVITLYVYCEVCEGRSSIWFQQHEGHTRVTTSIEQVPRKWASDGW